jgi:hypothetical protein
MMAQETFLYDALGLRLAVYGRQGDDIVGNIPIPTHRPLT